MIGIIAFILLGNVYLTDCWKVRAPTMSQSPQIASFHLRSEITSMVSSGIHSFGAIASTGFISKSYRGEMSLSSSPTNAVIKTVNGIKHKRLGFGDIAVSEVGLGTQRWVSDDFNAPNEELCFKFLDESVKNGISLVDTAEQYPIPSSSARPEGLVETTIGKWIAKEKGRREKLVIATKITGGRNVNRKNIALDCEGSLKRLGTDYIDIYLLHWPARYTPQSNWGQSLMYHHEAEPYYQGNAGFEEIAEAMGQLIKAGKIRGWGMCNDNAYGLAASCAAAKKLGVDPPCAMQNDFSLIDRRSEENGVSEASSPIHENVGFMAYNVLAGGYLTGKYFSGQLPTYDNPNFATSQITRMKPRGRHDEPSWSRTLYRYRSEPATNAIKEYAKLASKFGISLTEMSLRWSKGRTSVTTSLIGHTSMEQFSETLKYFRADPLPPDLIWEIDRVHMKNRLPIFSSTRVGEDWYGEGEIGERIP
jgi:aryl-alcohol dehydrogenase-like predicted oxidoreductase